MFSVGLHEAVADVGEQDAIEHVNAVVRGELAVLGERGRGIALAVFRDQLDLAARRLVVRLLERQLEAVEHVLAGLREDPRERPDVPDADRIRRVRRPDGEDHRQQGEDGESRPARRHLRLQKGSDRNATHSPPGRQETLLNDLVGAQTDAADRLVARP